MAVIQYTAIVNQVRGKLNGSVFNKARTVNTLQRKQQQPVGTRGFQSEIRNLFSQAQRSWKLLNNAQREQWQLTASNNPSRDRFGNQVVLAGYNQYIKAYLSALYGNVTPVSTPYTSPAPAFDALDMSISAMTFSVDPLTGVKVAGNAVIDAPGGDDEFIAVWDISLPVSPGVTVYHGRWVNVYGQGIPTIVTLPFTQSLGTRYPLPQVGQRIYKRGRVIHIASGAVVQEFIGLNGFVIS